MNGRTDGRTDERLDRRTAATTGTTGPGPHGPLARLDDLDDYEIADGEPDPRGWDVKTADGRTVGEVDSLIAERAAMEVRYLDVELDRKALKLDADRHVLIPIGRARLDDDHDTVRLDVASAAVLTQLPEYRHGAIDRDLENRTFRGLAAGAPGSDYYGHEAFDQRRFFGNRRATRANEQYLTLSQEQMTVGKRKVKAGEVQVRKEVEHEHVQRAVPTTHEEVVVERRPAGRGTPSRPQVGENEVRVPLMAEEAVVEKRKVPTEEVVVSKRTVSGRQTVEADLEKERAVVDRKGDVRRADGASDRR